MSVIYKYEIPWIDELELELAHLSSVVSFMIQHGKPHMWIKTEPDDPLKNHMIKRRFKIVGTGHSIGLNDKPLGSVIDGEFVWHLVEIID